jgi:tetratricopeptide (TPR) repeat protein
VFKHALVQDALYGSMLSQQRASLHLKIATEIERLAHGRLFEVAEQLAHHYRQTGHSEKAFQYLVMAGQKSLRVYSLDAAATYFNNALSLVEGKPECVDNAAFVSLLADMSYVTTLFFHLRELDGLVERYRSRIDRAAASPEKVILLVHHSFALAMMCQYERAFTTAQEGLEIASRLDDARSKAYARGALVLVSTVMCRGDVEAIERHGELAIVESDRTEDAYLQAWVRLDAAWSFLYRGLPDRGRALALELQERGRRLGDPRAAAMGLWIVGWQDIIDERYEDALIHGNQCIELALTPWDREVGIQIKGVAETLSGNVDSGVAMLRAHRQRALAKDYKYSVVGTDAPLGIGMVLQGDFARGVRFSKLR